MKLSDGEKAVITAMMHRGGHAIKEIAGFAESSEHSVRYIIKSLKERGYLIGRAPFINLYPLGYTGYTMFFSLSKVTIDQEHQVLDFIKKETGISWIGKIGGDYEYAVAFLTKRVEQVNQIFYAISKKFGDIFADKSFLITTKFYAFPRKYLAPKIKDHPMLYFGSTDKHAQIDQVDHEILSRMSQGNYLSHREVARDLQLHHTRLERRLQNLAEQQILSGYIYRFDLSALGMHTYRLLITANGIDQTLSIQLLKFAKIHPNILRFMETLGAWDYEMELEVSVAEEVSAIIQIIRNKFHRRIRGIRIIQIFRHLKFSGYPIS